MKSDGFLPNDSWVKVHSLKSISDGGILDPDDQLVAVVDDKDQILAIYEEQDSTPPPIPQSNGEGAGSSAGSCSPEWTGDSSRLRSFSLQPCSSPSPAKSIVSLGRSQPTSIASSSATLPGGNVDNSVEITSLDDPPSAGLMVRSGIVDKGGIIVNRPSNESPAEYMQCASTCFRDSIKIKCSGEEVGARIARDSGRKKRPAPPPPPQKFHVLQQQEFRQGLDNFQERISSDTAVQKDDVDGGCLRSPLGSGKLGNFIRSGGPRQSSVGDKWLLAQEKIEDKLHREEALINSNSKETEEVETEGKPPVDPSSDTQTKLRVDVNGLPGQPLGIQVTPDYSENGRLSGVVITKIHENGRIHQNGNLHVNDKIIEINERPVYQMSFVRAQSYLHEISQQRVANFVIIRTVASGAAREPLKNSSSGSFVEPQQLLEPGAKGPQSALQKANTRKIGQKLSVELKKGAHGLGFTVTSRDTAVEGERPFFIKTVLPRGAAIVDGRLKAGDRLLQINSCEVTGLSQRQVVNLLRDFKQGDTVKLVVSRQEDSVSATSPICVATTSSCPPSPPSPPDPSSPLRVGTSGFCPSPSLPRHLPPEKANVDSLGSERQKQLMNFDVPLNATGSAGLGVSVKGRIATGEDGKEEDAGIYIKGIIHGGAVQKDGRLEINDQLIGIEEARLLGHSNEDAMNMISRTMQKLDQNASSITLTVFRVVDGKENLSPQAKGSSLNYVTQFERCEATSDVRTTTNSIQSRYTIPGYGDYALIVKGSNYKHSTVGNRVPFMVEETTMIIQEEEGSASATAAPEITYQTEGVPLYEDIESTAEAGENNGDEVFNRDAPGRQSMSEKRHGGGKTDPSHTRIFQKIKEAKSAGAHQRQNSAPALQEIETVSPVPLKDVGQNEADKRRSFSLESLSRLPNEKTERRNGNFQQPMVHEMVSSSIGVQGKKSAKLQNRMKKVQRQRPTNDSFRQAVDRSYGSVADAEVGVDVGEVSGDEQHQVAHFSSASLPRPAKDKDRRKSTGSGLLLNWFGRQFGSATWRESSLEKGSELKERDAQDRAKRAAEEEQKKIREQYEKLKRQQQETQNRRVVSSSPKLPSRWRPSVPVPAAQHSLGEISKSATHLPPPPYQRLRHDHPPPPYHHIQLANQRKGLVHDHPAFTVTQHQETNSVPAWFAVAGEQKKLYRSLDRYSKLSSEDAKTTANAMDQLMVIPKYELCLRKKSRNGVADLESNRKQRPSSNFYDYGNNRLEIKKAPGSVFGNPLYVDEPPPDYSPLAADDRKNGFVIKM